MRLFKNDLLHWYYIWYTLTWFQTDVRKNTVTVSQTLIHWFQQALALIWSIPILLPLVRITAKSTRSWKNAKKKSVAIVAQKNSREGGSGRKRLGLGASPVPDGRNLALAEEASIPQAFSAARTAVRDCSLQTPGGRCSSASGSRNDSYSCCSDPPCLRSPCLCS